MKHKKLLSIGLLACVFSMGNLFALSSTALEGINADFEHFDDTDSQQMALSTSPSSNKHKTPGTKIDSIVNIQQRFYKFQDATSELKRLGHDSPDLFAPALATFTSFLDPSITEYNIYTFNIILSYNSVDAIAAAYTYFAKVVFNSYSQHFATNVVVTPVRTGNTFTAQLTAGGGEYASLNPVAPYEQTTLSNFVVGWVYLENGPTGPDWYINNYAEYGNRLISFCPPCGPNSLLFARQFPGSTPEGTVTSCSDCAAP